MNGGVPSVELDVAAAPCVPLAVVVLGDLSAGVVFDCELCGFGLFIIRIFAYDVPCFSRADGSNVIALLPTLLLLILVGDFWDGGDVGDPSPNDIGGLTVIGVCCGVSKLINLSSGVSNNG